MALGRVFSSYPTTGPLVVLPFCLNVSNNIIVELDEMNERITNRKLY